ncbi:MAG: hypothetical protein JST16_05355 [Bdellovibrionales bacterium]|nr:hypothetical protein [Bdellovibrionales bacterium]
MIRIETQQWTCDTCGKHVDFNDGQIWWCYKEDKQRNLKLTHGGKCTEAHDGGWTYTGGRPLKDFSDSDGLMDILSLTERTTLPPAEIFEIIKRLYVPGYESVRLDAARAMQNGVIEPYLSSQILHQKEIKAIQKWLRQQSD